MFYLIITLTMHMLYYTKHQHANYQTHMVCDPLCRKLAAALRYPNNAKFYVNANGWASVEEAGLGFREVSGVGNPQTLNPVAKREV